jgi:hypothetical protein
VNQTRSGCDRFDVVRTGASAGGDQPATQRNVSHRSGAATVCQSPSGQVLIGDKARRRDLGNDRLRRALASMRLFAGCTTIRRNNTIF